MALTQIEDHAGKMEDEQRKPQALTYSPSRADIFQEIKQILWTMMLDMQEQIQEMSLMISSMVKPSLDHSSAAAEGGAQAAGGDLRPPAARSLASDSTPYKWDTLRYSSLEFLSAAGEGTLETDQINVYKSSELYYWRYLGMAGSPELPAAILGGQEEARCLLSSTPKEDVIGWGTEAGISKGSAPRVKMKKDMTARSGSFAGTVRAFDPGGAWAETEKTRLPGTCAKQLNLPVRESYICASANRLLFENRLGNFPDRLIILNPNKLKKKKKWI